MIRRREFIAGLGAVTACPRLVLAQQGEQVRRIGLLNALVENDRASQTSSPGFEKDLRRLAGLTVAIYEPTFATAPTMPIAYALWPRNC